MHNNIYRGKTLYYQALKHHNQIAHMTASRSLLLLFLLLLLTLGGCGSKGPLYLPEPEKKTN